MQWFIQWTTYLNQTNHLGFALVTVITMSVAGAGVAVIADLVLKRIGAGKSAASQHRH